MSQIMSVKLSDITIALTSCWRFHLLQKTIESLAQSIDLSCYEKIMTEDSRDEHHIEKIKEANETWFLQWWNILYTKWSGYTDPFQCHKAALDLMYSKISTPYTFHCEDDWHFKKTEFDYLQLSKSVLESNKHIGIVCLRDRFQKNENNIWVSREKLKNIYFTDILFQYFWFTYIQLKPYSEIAEFYTLNPWLRRTNESKQIIIWHEQHVDEWAMWIRYKSMWLFTVNFLHPIVGHKWWLRNSTRFLKDGLIKSLVRIIKNGYTHYKVLYFKK